MLLSYVIFVIVLIRLVYLEGWWSRYCDHVGRIMWIMDAL